MGAQTLIMLDEFHKLCAEDAKKERVEWWENFCLHDFDFMASPPRDPYASKTLINDVPADLKEAVATAMEDHLYPSRLAKRAPKRMDMLMDIDPLTLGISPASLVEPSLDSGPQFPQHKVLRQAWDSRRDKLKPAMDSPNFAPRPRQQPTATDPFRRALRRDANVA